MKRYARRGQCFSTTKNVMQLTKNEVYIGYPDIERNGFCFSDGCGWIRPDLAMEIAREFDHTNMSAFQIRLGGAKGVLAVNHDPDIFHIDGVHYKVLLRKSQVKFPSDYLSLDIVRCATYS